MKLMIVFGSSRHGRKGEVVSNWVRQGVENDDRFEIDFVDLQTLNLPFFDEPDDPFNLKSYTHQEGHTWADRVGEAEGFILITPEYNHSYPPVLKNALDWVGRQWADKPVAFVGYGSEAGGARAVEHLRHVVATLGLVQLTKAINFPFFKQAFDESGKPIREQYNESLKKMLDEIIRLHQAFKKSSS